MNFGTLVHRPVIRRPVTHSFDRLVADLWRDLGTSPSTLARAGYVPRRRTRPEFAPRIAAEELENEYRVVAEVPGVDAADLDVNVEDGILTIRGERHYARPATPASVEESVDASVEESASDALAETAPDTPTTHISAKFERKLRFPGEVVEEAVTASLKNGVLTVTVPKQVEVAPEVRTIPVETA